MIKIRKIKANDAEEVKSLIEGIMHGEFTAESKAYAYNDLDDIVAHYGGKRETFLVAEEDGKIVGTVAIKEDDNNSALLRRIFLHKDYRGKGYGAELLAEATKFCLDHGYRTVQFKGTNRMQNALQLCLRNGFEQDDLMELGDFDLVMLSKRLDGKEKKGT